MKKVAIVHILGFLSKGNPLIEDYVKEVTNVILHLEPDVIITCGKYRGDAASPDESKELSEHLKNHVPSASYYTHPQTVTVIETLTNNAKLLKEIGEIDEVYIVCPDIQFYLLLFMALPAYSQELGYHKSKHEMYQAIIDIFKAKNKDELANLREIKMGKFSFYAIHGDWQREDYLYHMATTIRELICLNDMELFMNYTSWRKDLWGIE